MADLDHEIGPALPPGFKQMSKEVISNECPAASTADDDEGIVGPSLPPHLVSPADCEGGMDTSPHDRHRGQLVSDDEEDDDDTYGPALPPGFLAKQDSIAKPTGPTTKPTGPSIGPTMPPGIKRTVTDDDDDDDDNDNDNDDDDVDSKVGSERDDESEEESSEEEMIGPMPATEHDSLNLPSAAAAVEARAEAMKHRLTKEDDGVPTAAIRESWMTELPEFSKNFGMGPRTFRKNALPKEQDRSGWTETPADRARKHQERMEKAAAEMRASSSSSSSKDMEKKKKKKKKADRQDKTMSARDERLAQEIARHNESARSESLMEIHAKARKRKLDEEGTQKQERRAFDRETDLQVNRFDDARRKQLLKKSANLGDKFSHSNEKMYL